MWYGIGAPAQVPRSDEASDEPSLIRHAMSSLFLLTSMPTLTTDDFFTIEVLIKTDNNPYRKAA
jgi:hypothetical protein